MGIATRQMSATDPGRLMCVEGRHYRTEERIALYIQGGRLQAVEARPDEQPGPGPWIGPGLVDLQINGYGGLDFNTLPYTEGLVRQAIRALWRQGITTCLPTVITNSVTAIEAAVRGIAGACAMDRAVERSIAGIHLEGPFISPEDGPRGAHGRQHVKPPDWALFQGWQAAAGGRIKIITLSPEWPGATAFIDACVASGVTVAIGHTAATPEQVRDAVAAGAQLSTHLGNGAHLMLRRHPNYIWEQLAQDELWASVIADGFHLPEAVLKVILRLKGARAVLVSDAVALAGMAPGVYDTHIGGLVELTPEGKLHLRGNPDLLAGSAQMLTAGIAHLARSGICGFADGWEMASIRPAALMGLPTQHGLTAGAPADFVIFERDEDHVSILQTYKQGKLVYDARSDSAGSGGA